MTTTIKIIIGIVFFLTCWGIFSIEIDKKAVPETPQPPKYDRVYIGNADTVEMYGKLYYQSLVKQDGVCTFKVNK